MPDDKIILNESDPFVFTFITRYEDLRNQCTRRTINVLSILESSAQYKASLSAKVNFINNHFFQPYNFGAIERSGKKTAEEIFHLIKDLRKFYLHSKNPDVKVGKNHRVEDLVFNPDEISEPINISLHTVKQYEMLKLKCSLKTLNQIIPIEYAEGYHVSDEAKISFINKVFFAPFKFEGLRHYGPKTMKEINTIRLGLWKLPGKNYSEVFNGFQTPGIQIQTS